MTQNVEVSEGFACLMLIYFICKIESTNLANAKYLLEYFDSISMWQKEEDKYI
jgi:hypothetical protein